MTLTLRGLQTQADIRTPEQLLERALAQIVSDLDTVEKAEVFRIAPGGMMLWHGEQSAHQDGVFIAVESDAPWQRALDEQTLVKDADTAQWCIPLTHHDKPFALLVITGEIDEALLHDIALDLSLLVYSRQIEDLLQKQIATTGKLSMVASLSDVARVVAENIVQKQQFVSMNLFEYADDGQIVGGRVISTANRHDAYQTDLQMGINLSALEELRSLLLEVGEVLITDVQQEARFTDDAKQWLQSQRIRSMYVMPMWLDNQLVAFIGLCDTLNALAPTTLEKELYQNIAHQASIVVERQRLLERTQQSASRSDKQVRVLSLLNQLIAQANRHKIDQPILQQTADVLYDITGVDHVGIIIRSGNSNVVISEAPTQDLVGDEIEPGSAIDRIIEESGEALIITDLANYHALQQETREYLLSVGIRSLIVIPMFDENNALIGSVGLDYYTQQAEIEQRVIDTAETIVGQIALSLQNVRLLSESQQKAQQLERLTNFGQALRAYLSQDDILTTALTYTPDVLSADYVGVLLYEPNSASLFNHALYLQGESEIIKPAQRLHDGENTIAEQALNDNQLVTIADVNADWSWKHPQQRAVQSLMAMPLSLAGEMLGILEVGSAEAHHYNKTDANTLRQIGNQLAIALSNANAYSQSLRLARNKTQANEIITKLQEQIDVRDILKVTAEELGKAIGAKKARIRLGTQPSRTVGEQ